MSIAAMPESSKKTSRQPREPRRLGFVSVLADRLIAAPVIVISTLMSASIHVFVMSVVFHFPLFEHKIDPRKSLDVVLVNARTREAPKEADALAQANLAGGGNTDAKRRAKSPLPASTDDRVEMVEKTVQQQVQTLEQQAKNLMTQTQKTPVQMPAQDAPKAEVPQEKTPNTQELMARAMEMARLEAQISQDWDTYQRRPRREFIGARAKEYLFARYVEDWRIKVERIGNLNYPETARAQKIYGSLQLTVSIFADGKVEYVEVNRSSGSKILDDAAIRIVHLAAPYARFSEDMKKKADIVSITRTWMFTRADQLVSGE